MQAEKSKEQSYDFLSFMNKALSKEIMTRTRLRIRRLRFCFLAINREEILKKVLKLKTSKAFQHADIPTKIVKENPYIFVDALLAMILYDFPSSLNNASLTPVFKKGDRNSKDNYRPVSLLPDMFKIFDRCMFRQLCSFMFEFLPKYQSEFYGMHYFL